MLFPKPLFYGEAGIVEIFNLFELFNVILLLVYITYLEGGR